ncbi:MAG: selenide, water dikinase SelD [Bacteroidota bacterium]|nr:selenide, water dikinase SelD [Bacteroidota bacterium]
MNDKIRLTQYSAGGGCGCKISPADLEQIIKRNGASQVSDARLLVGNESLDDAAVYDLKDGRVLISTTDFFTPIVDDPFDFGRIASVNAMSDVYAMGGTPVFALAVLGWPLAKLPAEIASRVIDGARSVCDSVGIQIAGGHSIDIPEPVFGLVVNGLASKAFFKQNCKATAGCRLFLSKPLGIGAISNATKNDKVNPEDYNAAIKWMTRLNTLGSHVATLKGLTAMTDVTGFGLGGHLLEICKGSNLDAVLDFDALPLLNGLTGYIAQGCIPGGTRRNFKSYGHLIEPMDEPRRMIICDPQTSGGLLMAVEDGCIQEFMDIVNRENAFVKEIGYLTVRGNEPEYIRFS